jgi:hypothetical protein
LKATLRHERLVVVPDLEFHHDILMQALQYEALRLHDHCAALVPERSEDAHQHLHRWSHPMHQRLHYSKRGPRLSKSSLWTK